MSFFGIYKGKLDNHVPLDSRRLNREHNYADMVEQRSVLGRYQKLGVLYKMRKFYTSTTTIKRDSEREGADNRPPKMAFMKFSQKNTCCEVNDLSISRCMGEKSLAPRPKFICYPTSFSFPYLIPPPSVGLACTRKSRPIRNVQRPRGKERGCAYRSYIRYISDNTCLDHSSNYAPIFVGVCRWCLFSLLAGGFGECAYVC
jgi:hypothetical protein